MRRSRVREWPRRKCHGLQRDTPITPPRLTPHRLMLDAALPTAETPVATPLQLHPMDRVAAPTVLPLKPIVLREQTVLCPAIVRALAHLWHPIILRPPPRIIP